MFFSRVWSTKKKNDEEDYEATLPPGDYFPVGKKSLEDFFELAFEGARSIEQVVQKLKVQAVELEKLDKQGWKLEGPVQNGAAILRIGIKTIQMPDWLDERDE